MHRGSPSSRLCAERCVLALVHALWSDHGSDTRDSHNTERSRSAQRTERREAGTALHVAVCE
eukprot:scaffold71485_cov72-Phaeocystis_antarctica.AAC.4